MEVRVARDREIMGAAAAAEAAAARRKALEQQGRARLILATGASQFTMLEALVREPGVGWPDVTMFHLDEYVGMSADHPASFRRYLKERFVDKVPTLGAAHFVRGDAPDVEAECARLDALIAEAPVDVACIGIGENGHVAFNDPPADFETRKPYLIVNLDEACRRQQLGEGWVATLDDVPTRAISMSVRQILSARKIVCTVPDERKAEAVRNTLEGDVTNLVPASVLREHPDCVLFLDDPATKLLSRTSLARVTRIGSDP